MWKLSRGSWISHLQVGQRISLGYALSLSVAVCGTVAGFKVGYDYNLLATKREEHTRNKVELLHRLQAGILQSRTHQQQLIPLSQSPQQFEEEYAHIQQHRAEVKRTWTELKEFIKNQPAWLQGEHHKEIPTLFATYGDAPDLYFQELENLVQQINKFNSGSPQNVEQAQKLLLKFTNSELALQFDGISDDLVEIIEQSYQENSQAEAFSAEARGIAQKIVITSIGLSVVISIILAILTSRAIALPIQTLTNVARKSTEESNFDLQATIDRDDEIGTLAQSFNKLIASVKQLLETEQTAKKQLEAYNETLAHKVEERTQELQEKNIRLQELLAELQRTQVQMVQNEKMSALGQMVAGIAHEINNPVNFIHGNLIHVEEYTQNLLEFLQLYQKYYPHPIAEIENQAEEIELDFLQEDLPKILTSMQVGTERIRRIVLSLRNFSRTDESNFKAVDIHEGIDSTILILQYRLKSKPERPGIEIIKNYGDLPMVECYPSQLNQVFMNIFSNAIDAIEERNVNKTYQEIAANLNQITVTTSVIDSDWLQVAIADNGIGIPEDIQQKIFHPFFTTKPIGKGTGMGMSISYQIIAEKHGGKLNLSSTPGKGTEFLIQIPLQQPVNTTVVQKIVKSKP